MLYYLAQYIRNESIGTNWENLVSALRVFQYISFRSAGAAVSALAFSWWLGPRLIEWLRSLKLGQLYRDKAESSGGLINRVRDKKGTPSMGGLLIVLSLDLSVLLWAQWNELILLTLLSLVVLSGLGFYDDYLKITKQSSAGASGRLKLIVQAALALFISLYLWRLPSTRNLITDVMVPFYKFPVLTDALWAGVAITMFTIIGSSNAVNLTDGLDGLAIGCTIIVAGVFVLLTYIAGHSQFARYLQVPFVRGAGELTVFCSALFGAGLGFLWFNCHPAQVFMGDTGSLALGGTLGIVAVLIHQPFLLVIAGGVFVAETGSVMIQTGWFKLTRARFGEGRRIFLMAPLHHHFEKKGWHESQIVARFYILCVLFALVALGSLKIR